MTCDEIVIVRGRPADYGALSRFHYRAGKPGPCVYALSAVDEVTGELAGVLTVSMPTLNGPWRPVAWPHVFGRGALPEQRERKRETARRLNGFVRTISRVVVDPRYRGLGVARRLVAAYLAEPLTCCTEALASMGRWCPFFERAGMREVERPRTGRETRLRVSLRRLAIEPWELMDVDRAASVVRGSPKLCERLATWASYSSATRPLLAARGQEEIEVLGALAVIAAASLEAGPVVYVHGDVSEAELARLSNT
jgi:GNAT superfamily N-acetyltransferase